MNWQTCKLYGEAAAIGAVQLWIVWDIAAHLLR